MSDLTKIFFNEVTIGYYKDEPILHNVTFSVSSGELVYLIGKTASGKSSLLKTMYAEIPPLSGECRMGEFELHKIRKSKVPYLRRAVAVVFQDFQLLSDRTVQDNLLFVLKATGWKKKKVMLARINEVLTQVGLFDKQSSMPHQLSGGEQQRVVIARALLNNPEIILADEPTGNLDPESSEEIFKLLHSIAQTDCAVFLVTHNYSLLKKYPARTLKCSENTITEIIEQDTEIDFHVLVE
jgi:cell division transport system ATP-binding protein